MTDKSVYGGLFQDPSFISTDVDPKKTDPYDKQDNIPSRYLGKSMLPGAVTSNGLYPDVLFDHKFLTLASSDQIDSKIAAEIAKREKIQQKEEAKMQNRHKPISDKEFIYSSYPQQSSGPGSYYGCFQNKPYEYMTEPWEGLNDKRKKQRKGKHIKSNGSNNDDKGNGSKSKELSLPNIKTNPPKKGTYGVPGTLLNNSKYNDNWRAELEEYERAERKKKSKQSVERKPIGPAFHLSGVSHAYLDELPNTGASAVYNKYDPEEAERGKQQQYLHRHRRLRKQKEEERLAKEMMNKMAKHDKAFKICAANEGDRGCINPFPNKWINADELEAAEIAKNKRRGRRNKKLDEHDVVQRPKGAGEWIPNSFGKSSVVSSCLRRFY